MKLKNTLILFILFFFSFSVSAFSLKEVNPDEVNSRIHYFQSQLKYGALVEYIDSLKAQAEPQEPTESERLEALEMLMVDILGGGF